MLETFRAAERTRASTSPPGVTRTTGWLDGVYLSRDASLDNSDEPLVDRGTDVESYWRVRQTSLPPR